MISCKKRIQKAWENKELFFKPWIGRLYNEGVQLPEFNRRIRVLVIGASRYCEYLAKHGEKACPHRDACCFCRNREQLLHIADDCLFVNDTAARKGTHKDMKIDDINLASILKAYYGKPTKAYKKFQESLAPILECDEPQKVWLQLSFVNYFQPIVWSDGKDGTRTPRVSDYEDIYEMSRHVIERVIMELDPDLVLMWMPAQIRKAFDRLFPDAEPTGKAYKYNSAPNISFLSYYLFVNGRQILLQTTPHPTANYDYGAFIKKVFEGLSAFNPTPQGPKGGE